MHGKEIDKRLFEGEAKDLDVAMMAVKQKQKKKTKLILPSENESVYWVYGVLHISDAYRCI